MTMVDLGARTRLDMAAIKTYVFLCPMRSDRASGRTTGPARAPGRGKYDRRKNREERADEQRFVLLEAIGEVIAERGYAGTTVALICERAGMSRRTFYEHFRDLRRAILELHDF